MNSPKFLVLFAVLAASASAQQNIADQTVDRAITREHALLATLQNSRPVAETYIQDLANDNDFGAVPVKVVR